MPVATDDATQRFGARADAYARARPAYPQQAVVALVRALALPAGSCIVDLGCGTGLSSEAFLRSGFRLIGVEPNQAMRAHAAQLSARYRRFAVVDGRAESTGLDAACADLVIAAQAFHWFDVEAARKEALRILRRPPRAALIWNDRRTEGSEFARGYEQLLLRFGTEYRAVQERHTQVDRLERFFGHARWRTIGIAHSTPLDFDTLAERLNSASYVPSPADPRHGPMMQALRELFAGTARAGMVSMEFETRIHFAEMAGEALVRAPLPAAPIE